MTDQVRQFFTNGGQQAFVVRIGDDSLIEATADLLGVNGTAVIHLTAVSAGEDGNQLRATVDYNTAFPERTFNLTVFREVLDASGVATRPTSELFKDLSMDPDNPKFVATVLNKSSALVTATVEANDLSASASEDQGSSSSGFLSTNILASFTTAIPTVGGQGKFRISVGGTPFRTITFTRGASDFTTGQIQTTIETQAGLTTGTLSVSVIIAPDQFLRIASTTHEDVLIEPAGDSDIAVTLGLGTAQGGVEMGAFEQPSPAAQRPGLGARHPTSRRCWSSGGARRRAGAPRRRCI